MILFPPPADLPIFQAIFPISDYAGQIRKHKAASWSHINLVYATLTSEKMLLNSNSKMKDWLHYILISLSDLLAVTLTWFFSHFMSVSSK